MMTSPFMEPVTLAAMWSSFEVPFRYFSASMGEIGKSYNLTKERIRQIEGTALGKMKYPMLKRRASDFILT